MRANEDDIYTRRDEDEANAAYLRDREENVKLVREASRQIKAKFADL